MRRRTGFLVGILVASAGLFGAAKLFERQLGEALLGRVVEGRVGRDATAGLRDGLHVALCGTGSPLPDPTRAGPCTIVIAGKRIFVVDAGEGSARNINLMALPPGRIEALLLTHFHSDHIDGIGPLLLARWTGSAATSPLPVRGPVGVETVVDGFNTAYRRDHGYRVAHHGAAIVPPGGAGAVAVPFASGFGSVVVLASGGLKVTAFRVDHDPVSPAVGYRFDYKGRSVVLSGDTAKSASLVAAAKGADLLVHEALQPRLVKLLTGGLDRRGRTNTAQITRDILDYHATPGEAADSAKAAGVRHLVLNHIVPPLPVKFAYPAFLGDAPERFDGPITVGEDGMLFSLPASSPAIIEKRLL